MHAADICNGPTQQIIEIIIIPECIDTLIVHQVRSNYEVIVCNNTQLCLSTPTGHTVRGFLKIYLYIIYSTTGIYCIYITIVLIDGDFDIATVCTNICIKICF